MKYWLSCLLLLFVWSSAFADKYLTPKQIHAELLRKSKQKVSYKLSAADIKAKGLIPIEKFFPAEEKAQIYTPPANLANIKAPAEVNWMDRETPIKNQQNTGMCTAFAGVGAMENMLNSLIKSNWDLSELNAWLDYKQYSCAAFVKGVTNKKICDEAMLPFANSEKGTISAACKENAHASLIKSTFFGHDLEGFKKQMSLGSVGYIGMTVPSDMSSCPKVISPNSTATKYGHALAVPRYFNDSKFGDILYLRNSWGADCGDHGYMALPVSVLSKPGFTYELYTFDLVNSTKAEPTPTPAPTIIPTVTPDPDQKLCDILIYDDESPTVSYKCVRWKK